MAKQEEQPTKFELVREDNACKQTIKWDKKINPNGPISVETVWKQWILDEWEKKQQNQEEDE